MDTTTTAAVEHLQALGFNESEALAYAALLHGGPMTGYQLARASGVARPNVYGVIDRLEKRGALTRVGVGDGLKYAALPAGQMLAHLSSGIDAHISAAQEALTNLGGDSGAAYVWNLEGYDTVLTRTEGVISDASERLLLGLWSNESARLSDAVGDAQARGVHIVTVCVQGCASECGNCRGEVYRYPVSGDADSRWLMAVADDREALIGEIAATSDARAAHTALPVMVAVASQYIRNTIAVAEIVRSLGPRLSRLLDKESARAIEGTGLAAGGQSWWKHILATVRRART